MTFNNKIDHENAKAILTELESAQSDFNTLLDSVSEADWRRQSLNLGWINGEILAHMLFGFMILNALLPMARLWGRLPTGSSKPFAWLLNAGTRPFNWFNALGARGQGRVFTPQRIRRLFDWEIRSLVKKASAIDEQEWVRGMYYPTRSFYPNKLT